MFHWLWLWWNCHIVLDACHVLCVVSDYPGAPGQVQGAGSRADKDGALPCGSHTRTVPRILQKVHYPQ